VCLRSRETKDEVPSAENEAAYYVGGRVESPASSDITVGDRGSDESCGIVTRDIMHWYQ
jgi:hypothetical protein